MNREKGAGAPLIKELSFLLRIHFQQNASWQGTLHWLKEKKTVRFRSLLELTALMQEAMAIAQGTSSSQPFLTWEDKAKEEVS